MRQFWTFQPFMLVTLLVTCTGVNPVKLTRLRVPAVVQNGTRSHIVLDCEYDIKEEESGGLVLKWYLNSHTVPIYQWIPPSHPQGLGAMKGKIDLDYEISKDPYTRHRALYIYNPTIDMSGDYTCKVSTLDNEVMKTKKMVVYEPPRRVSLLHKRSSYRSVNITCLVDHVFPCPEVTLFHGQGRNRVRLKGVREVVDRYPDGAWQKLVYIVLDDSSLHIENLFECEMSVPHTNYVVKRSTLYSPRFPAVMARANQSGSISPQTYLGMFPLLLSCGWLWRQTLK